MSLSTQEQQALHSIEEGLSGSASKPVSLLAIFTRLTQDEEMPGREQIALSGRPRGAHRSHASRRLGPGQARRRPRMLTQPQALQRAGLLLWLAVAIGLVAVALAINRNGSPRTCTDPWIAACAAPAPAPPVRRHGQQPASARPKGQAPGDHMAGGPGPGWAGRIRA